MTITKPTKAIARKVIELVSHGLVRGQGSPEPGKMCVEAAVCFAMGLPHGDNPPCVAASVRSFKIGLNDSDWSSDAARAKGLRRLAVAQLCSNEIDETIFVKELALATIRKIVPIALRAAAEMPSNKGHKDSLESHAVKCESSVDLDAARAASDAASAAARAASDASAAASNASDARAASNAARAASNAASDAARAASNAASYAARAASNARSKDEVLSLMAECAVQALIKCKSPGCKWLDLCE